MYYYRNHMRAQMVCISDHQCSTPGCKSVLILDGNMKNHRDVCKATHAGFTAFDGLPGQVKTGCQKTPDFKSRYCSLHKPRACCLSQPPLENQSTQVRVEQPVEGVIEEILEKKVTRNTTYYKVMWTFELPTGVVQFPLNIYTYYLRKTYLIAMP